MPQSYKFSKNAIAEVPSERLLAAMYNNLSDLICLKDHCFEYRIHYECYVRYEITVGSKEIKKI